MNIVTAQHLDTWSSSLSARAELPELVASLIRASCPSLQSYRFPSHDASQMHGFDGVAEVLEGHLFVPQGTSIWEFGAGKDYRTKATDDYDKRTAELTLPERASRSFTFVTSRKWDGDLDDWVRHHSGDGWLKVRALDAASLEHWLSECLAVAIPLARKLGIIPPSGVRTLQDFWDDEYKLSFAPPATPQLLLGGRANQAKALCDGLAVGRTGVTKWQADSPTEAIAFVAAAVMSADSDTSNDLLSKTLIVDTVEAARIIPSAGHFVFVLPPGAARAAPALARKSQVIIALGTDYAVDSTERLERISIVDFASGLKTMGIEENEAFRLAGICGRSPTVLSRLISSGIYDPPKWREDPELVPLVLAGGWDASSKNDCTVVAAICGTTYDKVDAAARRLASTTDAPLDLDGAVWTLRSAKDAFTLVGSLVNSALQARLHDACVAVFSERDRTLDAREADRQPIPIRGEDFGHSEWLRRGLARTLLLISGLHQAAKFVVIGGTPEEFVDSVIEAIPGIAEDIRSLASLKAEFPRLCEAAPRPLAYALERVLEGDREKLKGLVFRDTKDGSPWGASPHTYLLWGLETLAWNPEYLLRAASILMSLAAVDPGGRLANRPLDSLREIFLAWRPNTYAAMEDRIAALRAICMERPEPGLKLLMSLLPGRRDLSSGTAKPQLRDFGQSKSNPTTKRDVWYAFQQHASIAVDLAGTNISLLTDLVGALPQLDPPARSRALKAFENSAKEASPAAVYNLWAKLRDLVQQHRNFAEAPWALKGDQLTPIDELCRAIEPSDPVLRVSWLFNEYAPKAGMPKGGDDLAEANKDRAEVVRHLLRDHGLSAVLQLAATAKLPHFVGTALVDAEPDAVVLLEALSKSMSAGSNISQDFGTALSSAARERIGSKWGELLASFSSTIPPDTAASLFFRWRDTRETWTFVDSLPPEVQHEYWARKPAFRPSSQDELSFAFDRYAQVDRFSAILDMAGYNEGVLSTPQCMVTLWGLARELAREPRKMQHVHYEVVHMIQALQRREDVDLGDLAALEYQYLPLLELQAEPIALNHVMASSPELFVKIVCDAFTPASGEKGEITEERRSRARLAYRLLQSIKTVPGFAPGEANLDHLRSWIFEVRALANAEDRAVIADQQIGQILAFAPSDTENGAWPCEPIRGLIEELRAPEIEKGIAISRFNQRGTFTKAMYDGGKQERDIAQQYRKWADTAHSWPHTSALLRQIADDWDRHAERADREAQLDQLRDS